MPTRAMRRKEAEILLRSQRPLLLTPHVLHSLSLRVQWPLRQSPLRVVNNSWTYKKEQSEGQASQHKGNRRFHQ